MTIRKITRRTFATLAGAAAGAASLGLPAIAAESSLQRVKASGVLRVAGVPDGVPYYQRDLATGKWRGFYVDICQKLADDLGLKMELAETTWGNSVLDLQANKLDVFFGLNPTPARKEVIDFSVPVFNNAFTLVARKGLTGTTWADFDKPEIRISVDAGSSNDAAATRNCPKATITRLKTQSDATTALQAGRADAQCLALILSLALKAKVPAIGDLVIPAPFDATTSNAGFRREDDKSWQEFVSDWIGKQRESGFVKEAIVRNMALVGVKESGFPPGFSI